MIFIKSFCGEALFVEDDAPDKAIKRATDEANDWISDLESEGWKNICVQAQSTTYLPAGDFAMYVITLSLNADAPE